MGAGPLPIPFFFFFFHSTQLPRVFLALLLSLRCLVDVFIVVRIIPHADVFVGEGEFHDLLLYHLDPIPQKVFIFVH